MASNINYTSIDETYPIAGRDNDSQGFRDNFGVIKNSFESAKGEIEDLQLNAARLDVPNDFNGNNLLNANFSNCSEDILDETSVNSTTLVDYAAGSYQAFQVTGDMQFTLANFPTSGKLGRMRIQLRGDDLSHTVTFGISGAGSFLKSTEASGLISVVSSSTYKIYEFWTYNGANTVFMDYVGSFN
jgi:hypothetical protein